MSTEPEPTTQRGWRAKADEQGKTLNQVVADNARDAAVKAGLLDPLPTTAAETQKAGSQSTTERPRIRSGNSSSRDGRAT
jgi:hypothetical protein